ncbi:DNA recombination protein RmuC [Idiomarina sp. PL1-037]|uniref:DNA recombination protein RmuC n=1 Tax=Idiomarina sp. PL1-037 TaxID=3095365 RepID=UPI002ACBDE5F|nr:DNA recombination protein RmuC [Idiomarina sp. PL1-037]WQC54248.1 DNA recombination protein RmuC [Idiomarina sp. PL1-037]
MMSLALWQWMAIIGVPVVTVVAALLLLWQQQRRLRLQAEQQNSALEQDADILRERVDELQLEVYEKDSRLRETLARAEHEQKTAEEKLNLLKVSEERLTQQFENLANRIFDEKSKGLQQHHQQSLQATLEPFKQQIDAFKKQITQQYTDETKERSALKNEVMSLKDLNRQMASEAEALTRALKGDTKQQGNWGEVVLERILEQSGLREGHEYQTQAHHRDEEGKSFKPDVIVHLPNKKDVVIDSKVSLSAYERYFNSDDDAERERALNEHVQSLKQHIKQLGKKSYHQLEGLRTLDYVLMFIPIEPAFLLAVDRDPELIRLALDNQIMLVSPTNLLVALRTVHNIWQYEYQNQNAEKIATDAARLYDKFVGFVEDLEKIGNGLQTLDNRYQEAMKKLSTGRGNLIGRVDKFRQMGVQTNKRLNPDYLDSEETSPEGIKSDGADKKND